MNRFSLGFIIVVVCAVSLRGNEVTPAKATVVDYFLLLPADQFEAPLASWLRHIRSGQGVIDEANGFIHCLGDGAQPNFDVALFRYKNGKPLWLFARVSWKATTTFTYTSTSWERTEKCTSFRARSYLSAMAATGVLVYLASVGLSWCANKEVTKFGTE